MSDSLLHQIALTRLPQVGAVTAKTLVSYCGSAEAVFSATKRELLRIPGIGQATVAGLKPHDALLAAERELDFLQQHGVEALFYTDSRYPPRLRQNPDCPALLFFKGSDPALLDAARIVAVVGTRQPTDYGRALCEELIDGLMPLDVVVVSGLAFGIDITAHRRACQQGLPNIGVLGHGLGSIYPNQHKSTAHKMIENGGLLSEYVHDVGPDREHFPMRNRIIAGLCDALVVVETGQTGGSIISAELAAQYTREVFAFPGRVRDQNSIGCNQLIKNNRAHLIESVEDLVTLMGWTAEGASATSVQTSLFPDLDDDELRLTALLREKPGLAIDELSDAAGLLHGNLARLLLGLEFKGVIRTLPGKRYRMSG